MCRDDFLSDESRQASYKPTDSDFWKMNSSHTYFTAEGNKEQSVPKVLGVLVADHMVMKYQILVHQYVGVKNPDTHTFDNASKFGVYPSYETTSRVTSYYLDAAITKLGPGRTKKDFAIDMPDTHMGPVQHLLKQYFGLFQHWRIGGVTTGPNLQHDKVPCHFVALWSSHVT